MPKAKNPGNLVILGDVNSGGDFVGRDQIVNNFIDYRTQFFSNRLKETGSGMSSFKK